MIKKLLSLGTLAAALIINSQAQAQDVTELIKAAPADATKLVEGYMNPLFKGFGFGMNSAWYNSAKTKNLGRFDLKIQATGVLIPESQRNFDVKDIGLSNKVRYTTGNSITPTLAGEDKTGVPLKLYDDAGNLITTINMVNGANLNIVPSPQIQLTVGLIKNSEVSLRYSPDINTGDFGTVGTFGIGIKKEITSLLPGKSEKILPFDLSVAFGYNQITYKYEVAKEDQLYQQSPNNKPADLNQRLDAKFSGYTFDAIISKKLAIFTPFASVGYNTAKTKFGVLGKYNVQTGFNNFPNTNIPNQNSPKYTDIIDPVSIDKKTISGLRGNVGFSLHLLAFRLYGAYSIGEYQAATVGFGFGIGK